MDTHVGTTVIPELRNSPVEEDSVFQEGESRLLNDPTMDWVRSSKMPMRKMGIWMP